MEGEREEEGRQGRGGEREEEGEELRRLLLLGGRGLTFLGLFFGSVWGEEREGEGEEEEDERNREGENLEEEVGLLVMGG